MVKLRDNYDLLFEIFNRGKKSVAIDLRKEESRKVMKRLVQWCDVLAENFRPGTLAGWGYNFDQLKAWNSEIIYGSNSGFGPKGRFASLGSFDLTTQAFSGAMVAQGGGPSHKPMVIEHCAADEVGAMNFAFAILSALVAKLKTGKGQRFETSQLGAMVEYQANGTGLPAALKYGRTRDDGKPPFETNPTQTYFQAGDGLWFVVGYPAQKFWESLCRVVGREDLITHEKTRTLKDRFRHAQFAKDELQKTFKTEGRQHWLDLIHSVKVIFFSLAHRLVRP
jgi:crotonobetainyl-CoA:carnitine CoA-transferase CaiB-like acyl-CoA transferase